MTERESFEAWELTACRNSISEVEGRALIRQTEQFHGIRVKS